MTSKRRLYFIYIISFLDLFAVGLIFPLLYPHVRSLGATHFTVGLLGSTYAALQVLTGPLIGSWSDIRGRKFVLISTLLLCSICYIALGLTSSVFFIFLIRFVLGTVKHTQTLCKAIIADILPREKHAEAYGQSSGLGILGFVVGPIIGGHISEHPNGFLYVCALTSLLFLINIGFALNVPDVPRKSRRDSDALVLNVHKEMLKAFTDLYKIDWRVYWEAFSVRFLFGLTVSIYYSSQSVYLQEKFNLSQPYVGYTISFSSIIGVGVGLSLGLITRIFYKGDISCFRRILHSFVTLSVCFIGFYLSTDFYVYIAMLVPFAVSSTILRIVSMELMLSKSGSDEKGSLSGASNSIMSVARFITPLTSGVIGDVFSENAVMVSAFVPAVLGILLSLKLKKPVIKTD